MKVSIQELIGAGVVLVAFSGSVSASPINKPHSLSLEKGQAKAKQEKWEVLSNEAENEQHLQSEQQSLDSSTEKAEKLPLSFLDSIMTRGTQLSTEERDRVRLRAKARLEKVKGRPSETVEEWAKRTSEELSTFGD